MYPITSGLPGPQTTRSAELRTVRKNSRGVMYLEAGRVITAAKSRDPSNTGYLSSLRAGLLMGMITATGQYAPSVLGLSGDAVASADTSMTNVPAAVVTELVRRVGSSGTFKLTGPPTAAGTVRTLTVTYSAASGTTITITALGVNAVHTLGFTGSPSGTFRLRIIDLNGVVRTTGPITYSATPATLVSNINTALDAAFGAGLIVASGSAVTAIAITFSGAGYAKLPQTLTVIDSDGLTAGLVTVTNTTTGVDGRFVAASFIQPTDGSETPICLIDDGDAIRVTDIDGNDVDQPFPRPLIGGSLVSANIINWPSDTSLRAWVVSALNNSVAGGPGFVFDHLTGG